MNLTGVLTVSLLILIVHQLMRLNEQISDFRIESMPPDEGDLWEFFTQMIEADESDDDEGDLL